MIRRDELLQSPQVRNLSVREFKRCASTSEASDSLRAECVRLPPEWQVPAAAERGPSKNWRTPSSCAANRASSLPGPILENRSGRGHRALPAREPEPPSCDVRALPHRPLQPEAADFPAAGQGISQEHQTRPIVPQIKTPASRNLVCLRQKSRLRKTDRNASAQPAFARGSLAKEFEKSGTLGLVTNLVGDGRKAVFLNGGIGIDVLTHERKKRTKQDCDQPIPFADCSSPQPTTRRVCPGFHKKSNPEILHRAYHADEVVGKRRMNVRDLEFWHVARYAIFRTHFAGWPKLCRRWISCPA